MVYLTGDTHGDFGRVERFCQTMSTTKDDILVVLGDAGVNFSLDERDIQLKKRLSQLPISLFCVHGNHEEYPENIASYRTATFQGGEVFIEPNYPNLIFAKDGEFYELCGKTVLVLGGAYSVDKHIRLTNGYPWFESEQISDLRKVEIEAKIADRDWKADFVFSHTCPYYTRPVHLFLRGIDQKTVDSSMEVWLQKIADKLAFERWYFGHYHDDWDNGKYTMLYTDIIPFPFSANF